MGLLFGVLGVLMVIVSILSLLHISIVTHCNTYCKVAPFHALDICDVCEVDGLTISTTRLEFKQLQSKLSSADLHLPVNVFNIS